MVHAFSSKLLYPSASPGSKEHKANMEHMTEKIRTCIFGGSFGSRPLHAYRGVKRTDFIFTDEEQLQTFLELNEEGKMQFFQAKYTAKPGEVLTTLQFQWEVDEQFEGDYRKDYQSLHNELIEDVRTAWADKYTAAVYTRDEDANCRRYELQPIPDYLRWYKTGELHYLPLEERARSTFRGLG